MDAKMMQYLCEHADESMDSIHAALMDMGYSTGEIGDGVLAYVFGG